MPLIEELPPIMRPAFQVTLRPPSEGSGSVWWHQSRSGLPRKVNPPAGMRAIKPSALPPASSRITRLAGFSDRRLASTLPALPPPMIT